MVVLSNRVNGFSSFHLSFLLLLNSAGIFVDILPRDGFVNDSNLFDKSIMNKKLQCDWSGGVLLKNFIEF